MPDGVDFTWAAQDGVVNIEVEFVRGTSFPFMAPPYSQLVFLYGFDSDVADYLTQRYDDQLISSAQVAIRQTGIYLFLRIMATLN